YLLIKYLRMDCLERKKRSVSARLQLREEHRHSGDLGRSRANGQRAELVVVPAAEDGQEPLAIGLEESGAPAVDEALGFGWGRAVVVKETLRFVATGDPTARDLPEARPPSVFGVGWHSRRLHPRESIGGDD